MNFLLIIQVYQSRNRLSDKLLDARIQEHPALYVSHYWKAIYAQDYFHDLQQSLTYYKLAIDKLNTLKADYLAYFFSTHQYADKETILMKTVKAYIDTGQAQKAKLLIYATKLRCPEINLQPILIYFDILVGSFSNAEGKCIAILNNRKPYMGLASDYWHLLALAQLKLGNLDSAVNSCTRSLELNVLSYDAWQILGLVQIERMEWASAISTFQKMLEMDPFDFRCWRRIGFCEFKLGDMGLAKDAYEKTLSLNPFEAENWVDLGNILIKHRENEQAVFTIKKGMSFGYLSPEKRAFAEELLLQTKI